jgi:histidinol-phosphate aminotransferase
LHERSFPIFSQAGKEVPLFLDKNENPFRLPPSPREELRQLISSIDLNRYPDPEGAKLKKALSDLTGIHPGSIVIGNGGDEILSMLFSAFVERESSILTLRPTFSQYPELCKRHKASWVSVPLCIGESEVGFDENLFFETLHRTQPALILLDTPNNPTGRLLSNEFLSRILEEYRGVLVVDEAYGEFSRSTFLETFRGGVLPEKLCILKTLSKAWGLAGLRLGYAACSSSVSTELEKVRDLYNVGLLAQEMSTIVLQYTEWMESRVLSIRYMRDQLVREINRIHGWQAFQSESNFLLVNSPYIHSFLRDYLENLGIHVKYIDLDVPGNWIRLSVGREDELGRFLSAIQQAGASRDGQEGVDSRLLPRV